MADNDDLQRGQVTPPNRDHTINTDRQAAANVIRGDIDRIFDGEDAPHAEAEREIIAQKQAASSPAVEQLDAHETQVHSKVADQWKQYHTSWQSYYQQYYERYYLNHVAQLKHTPRTSADSVTSSDETTEEDKAVSELREKLLDTVKDRATNARKSRHFAPIATAVCFALVFLFLQYNSFLFASVKAYISPGSADPQNIIVDQTAGTKVGPEPKLVIPKINVEAPVVYGVNPADNNVVEDNLKNGVVHYPIANAASNPGQNGATVILGHSSNDVFDNGAYKFIFVQLNRMEIGDTFFINYQGTRYTYSITKKEIIDPTEVSKVTGDPTKPSAILITCDPPGTALKRLLVFAEQISPNPADSAKAPTTDTKKKKTQEIQGNSPTLIERLFGAQ